MPRGGRRAGTPGKAYSNRSDLSGALPMQAAGGQQYGKRAEQMAAQRAIPMAGSPASAAPAPMAPPPGAGGPQVAVAPPVPPGGVTPLSAPTERPDEPVTAGVPVGPGPGVEALGALGQAGSDEDVAMALRAAYEAYPSEDLRMIIERLDLG